MQREVLSTCGQLYAVLCPFQVVYLEGVLHHHIVLGRGVGAVAQRVEHAHQLRIVGFRLIACCCAALVAAGIEGDRLCLAVQFGRHHVVVVRHLMGAGLCVVGYGCPPCSEELVAAVGLEHLGTARQVDAGLFGVEHDECLRRAAVRIAHGIVPGVGGLCISLVTVVHRPVAQSVVSECRVVLGTVDEVSCRIRPRQCYAVAARLSLQHYGGQLLVGQHHHFLGLGLVVAQFLVVVKGHLGINVYLASLGRSREGDGYREALARLQVV